MQEPDAAFRRHRRNALTQAAVPTNAGRDTAADRKSHETPPPVGRIARLSRAIQLKAQCDTPRELYRARKLHARWHNAAAGWSAFSEVPTRTLQPSKRKIPASWDQRGVEDHDGSRVTWTRSSVFLQKQTSRRPVLPPLISQRHAAMWCLLTGCRVACWRRRLLT